nr:hypothetical protein [Candidatus Woesearchaeota archaeon]
MYAEINFKSEREKAGFKEGRELEKLIDQISSLHTLIFSISNVNLSNKDDLDLRKYLKRAMDIVHKRFEELGSRYEVNGPDIFEINQKYVDAMNYLKHYGLY